MQQCVISKVLKLAIKRPSYNSEQIQSFLQPLLRRGLAVNHTIHSNYTVLKFSETCYFCTAI
jgi:hypothetical protein